MYSAISFCRTCAESYGELWARAVCPNAHIVAQTSTRALLPWEPSALPEWPRQVDRTWPGPPSRAPARPFSRATVEILADTARAAFHAARAGILAIYKEITLNVDVLPEIVDMSQELQFASVEDIFLALNPHFYK